MKILPANDIKGCLIDGAFRVYDKDAPESWGNSPDGFRDFVINHSDITVIIKDPDGEFRFNNNEFYDGTLDHSRSVLGIWESEDEDE